MPDLKVIPVHTRAHFRAFVDLPWKLYQDDPNWVPPLRLDFKSLMTPGKHPFWLRAERELFIALRGDQVVGRVAAIVDDNYNHHYHTKLGSWGFFECERNAETSKALFSAAEDWLRSKGMDAMRGPLNPSINYEIGTLIYGFDRPPSLGFTYNPPYYHELIIASGQVKEKDVQAFRFEKGFKPPDWIEELAAKISQKQDITIRAGDRMRLKEEIELVQSIYNECWSENWGSVPMTDEETAHLAKELRWILDVELVFIIYVKDLPIGVAMILPDVNPFLQKINGKLGPKAVFRRLFCWKKDINGLRGYIMGIKEEYRQMGAPLVAYDYFNKMVASKPQYEYMELGWLLEDNDAINRLFEEGGGRPSRRFRVYHKPL